MADVALEVMDLLTGQIVGTSSLTLNQVQTFEFDVGNYRFRATYLVTGEVQSFDRVIVEGVNLPLDFTFTPLPTNFTLSYQSNPIVVPCTVNEQPLNSGGSVIIPSGTQVTISVPSEVNV